MLSQALLYEYAITPDIFECVINDSHLKKDVESFLLELYHGERALIANFHKGEWLRRITRALLASQGHSGIKKLIEQLVKRKRIVQHADFDLGTTVPIEIKDWFDLVISTHHKVPFHIIFTSREYCELINLDGGVLLCPETLASSNRWLEQKKPASIKVPRNPEHYKMLLRPILKYSRRLWLIDPYFDLSKPSYRKTVEICASLLNNSKPPKPEVDIEIHIKEIQKRKYDFSDWKKQLALLSIPSGCSFRVFLWRDTGTGTQRFHNRHIISEQCGLLSGDSLECLFTDAENDWALMSMEDRQATIRQFTRGTSPYTLLQAEIL